MTVFWPIRTMTLDKSNWGFRALICMRKDQSRTRGGTSVHINQLSSGWEITLSFGWAETGKMLCQSTVEQSGAEWYTAELCEVEDGPGPRAVLKPCCFHSRVVPQLICSTAALFSQPQTKLGIPVIWIGANNHRLTRYICIYQIYILSSWVLGPLLMSKVCISNCLQSTSLGCRP